MELNINSNLPIVTIGPIIGKVTDNTARILIELDRETDITVTLTEELRSSDNEVSEGKKTAITNKCTKELPKVFIFNNLNPLTKYNVTIDTQVAFLNPELKDLKSSFRTTATEGNAPEKFNLGFISCNSAKYYKTLENKDYCLWENLALKVKNEEINYLVHMGDQLYVDDGAWKGNHENCFSRGKKIWQEGFKKVYGRDAQGNYEGNDMADLDGDAHKEKDEEFTQEKIRMEKEILHIISEEYRENWNVRPIAETLRNAPNMMILDDHEIYDDFGFMGQSYFNKNTFEWFFADKARYCYYKYQKQLVEDIDFDNYQKVDTEHHYHIINDVGIFVQDFRGCFTWLKDKENIIEGEEGLKGKLEGFIGKKQTEDIRKCFGENGLFQKTKYSFYVSANPVIFFSSLITNLAKEKVNDCYEQWAFAAADEQAELLDLLANFKKNSSVETMLVSGDVHLGCFTSIFKNDEYVLQQMITSPICQKPPTDIEMKVVDVLRFSQSFLKDGYTFKHSGGTNECNYGFIRLKKSGEKYIGTSTHVKSNGERFSDDLEDLTDHKKAPCCTSCEIL